MEKQYTITIDTFANGYKIIPNSDYNGAVLKKSIYVATSKEMLYKLLDKVLEDVEEVK